MIASLPPNHNLHREMKKDLWQNYEEDSTGAMKNYYLDNMKKAYYQYSSA